MRVGLGWDTHPLKAGRPLVLLGTKIEAKAGPQGHSDGDALAHAIADALLGAAGLGDLGSAFPDTEEWTANLPGPDLLARTVAMVAEAGWAITNIDAQVRLESPQLAPHFAVLTAKAAAILGTEAVRITARHGEGLGPVGRGEAIEAMAVALLANSPAKRGSRAPVVADSTADPEQDQATVVRFDGGSRGNPGPAAAAAVAFAGDRVLDTSTSKMGTATNNEAEYEGMMLALALAAKWSAPAIEADSKLVVEQVLGRWKVKSPHLRPLALAARTLWQEVGKPTLTHVRRAKNGAADALVNEALDSL